LAAVMFAVANTVASAMFMKSTDMPAASVTAPSSVKVTLVPLAGPFMVAYHCPSIISASSHARFTMLLEIPLLAPESEM
jgi:hypothetical protein